MGFCAFFVAISAGTTRVSDATVWPLRVFTLLCVGVAGYAGNFMLKFGTLYVCGFDVRDKKGFVLICVPQVNWPKLNTPQWALEAYQDTLEKAHKDPLIGKLVGKSGQNDGKLGSLEEGKKRRE